MNNTRIRNPRTAVAYIRVSTDDQKLGPEAQRAAIQSWAQHTGVHVAAWHEDRGVSGGSDVDERPALTCALVDLRERRAGVLVVAKRDRLARDVAVAIAIDRAVTKQGAKIVSADGTANGTEPGDEFMRVVIDGAAQYERALIRARTRAALQAKRARGFRAGCVPFGFEADDEGRLHPAPAEQDAIALVLSLRAEGHSLRSIVSACSARGLRSRAGTPLQLTQVARISRSKCTSR
jgi:DNA invertase Pin-like site-specific DNA recombinase